MILHILGGGDGQLSAIRRCRQLSIETFVTDQNLHAPGCLEADYCALASTFDAGATGLALTEFSKQHGCFPDGILVTATDQPLLTAALVSESLGIPYFLSSRQAEWFSNKIAMKRKLREASIPVADFRCIGKNSVPADLVALRFPAVIKPVDSQGQRGVYRVESADEVFRFLDEVLSYSRKREVMVEEFYESDELTLSGWVSNGELHVLSLTDRVTESSLPSIGVCVAHHFPSRHSADLPGIRLLSERIISLFEIRRGPVYFQFLKGKDGILLNEAAARLGGAYEDRFIPWINGVDILDIMIKMSCGINYDNKVFDRLPAALDGRAVSLQMFFCSTGTIASAEGMDRVLKINGVLDGGFLLENGTEIVRIKNSTQRAGWFITAAGSKEEADRITRNAYSMLSIKDVYGREMIKTHSRMFFKGENSEKNSNCGTDCGGSPPGRVQREQDGHNR